MPLSVGGRWGSSMSRVLFMLLRDRFDIPFIFWYGAGVGKILV